MPVVPKVLTLLAVGWVALAVGCVSDREGGGLADTAGAIHADTNTGTDTATTTVPDTGPDTGTDADPCDPPTEGCPCSYKGNSNGVCGQAVLGADGACAKPDTYEEATVSEAGCDGLDNDCDGITDEGCPCDYQGDSDGVCATATVSPTDGACAAPETYEKATDTEASCGDGLDNDCDGVTDEGCPCDYQDHGDGVCATATISPTDGACAAPGGYEATETSCDSVDNDCDGVTDEGCPCDYQGDSHGVCATATLNANGVCPEPTGYEATETACDGLDNDCDGVADEGCPCQFQGLNQGVCTTSLFTAGGVCGKPDGYEATEASCDGLDNDCDGVTDEGCTCDYQGDTDGVCGTAAISPTDGTCAAPDSYEDPTNTEAGCGDGMDNDCDGVTDEGCTCNYKDNSDGVCGTATIRPTDGACAAPEGYEEATDAEAACDGLDNDCDGVTDEGCACEYKSTSVGVCGTATISPTDGACAAPEGYEEATDAEAACDGRDNDCDGVTDEGCACNYDDNHVGVCGTATISATNGACQKPTGYEATETSCDSVDNDCDGVTDEGCPCNYTDNSDGVCATATISPTDGACAAPDSYEDPTNTEAGCEGLDNDCDGVADEGCPCSYDDNNVGVCATATRDTTGACQKPTGYEATETSCEGLDNDCDGVTDEGCPCDYQDSSDGVCATATRDTAGACQKPTGYEATEASCDGVDNDCDGVTDEGCPCDYKDHSDGVCGAATISATDGACLEPTGYEATEASCDGLDNDCDGVTDEGCACDLYGLAAGVCLGAGIVDAETGACSGSDPTTYEILETSCDGLDNDCDGIMDEGCAGGAFVQVPAGTFTMGSPVDELGHRVNEAQHPVTLTRSFYMQETEVTQGQWEALMGNNHSYHACGTGCPMERVNWWDALAYANAVSISQGLPVCYFLEQCTGTAGEIAPDKVLDCTGVTVNATGGDPYLCTGYRLPTEAEWEYAYRAGTTTAFYNGDITAAENDPNLDVIGWYVSNAANGTHPAALKEPNAWGLYDMAGNVFEWTWDRFATYPSGAVTDPTGGETDQRRMGRGGAINGDATEARAAVRALWLPDQRRSGLGFRLARTLP